MWTRAELVRLIIEHENKLLQLILDHERKVDVSAPEPVRQPEPAPANETYTERLYRLAREDAAAGRSISMNDMLRSIPKPKPPRKPSWG